MVDRVKLVELKSIFYPTSSKHVLPSFWQLLRITRDLLRISEQRIVNWKSNAWEYRNTGKKYRKAVYVQHRVGFVNVQVPCILSNVYI